MSRTIALVNSVLAFGLLLASACPLRANQPNKDGLIESFEIFNDGDVVLVPVKIGAESYLFAVDTGCENTIFDESISETVENASRDARLGKLPLKLRRGIPAIDLAAARKASGHDIRGIVGMDFLRDYVVRLDCDSARLLFLEGAGKEAGQSVPIEYRYSRPFLLADLADWGVEPFLVDTGCVGIGTGWLDTGILKGVLDLGAATNRGTTRSIRMAGNSTTEDVGPIAFVKGLALAGFRHSQLEFGEHPQVNVLGLGYWSRYSVTFDFPNAVMYLKPGKRFNVADKPDKSGLHLFRIDGETIAKAIDNKSPAAVAGIKSGDAIVSIGGLDCGTTRPYVLRRALSEAEKTVDLVVRRDTKEFSISLLLDTDAESTQGGEGGQEPDVPSAPAPVLELQPGESLPVGPPPEHAFAKIHDGQLYLKTFLFQQNERRQAKVTEKDGVEFVEELITRKRTTIPLTSIWPLTSAQAFVDGKQLSAKELSERLTKEQHVLLSANMAKVDPFYLELVKPGTVILVLPRPLSSPGSPVIQGQPYGAAIQGEPYGAAE